MKNERGSDSDIQMRTVRSVHVRRATYCMHRCLRLCAHLLVYTDCLSELQMTLLLIRNDARTNGDSREKSQKPKVQKGNASIKIFIKTTLFTQSSMTNDSPLPVGLFFFFVPRQTTWVAMTQNKGKSYFFRQGNLSKRRYVTEISRLQNVSEVHLSDHKLSWSG